MPTRILAINGSADILDLYKEILEDEGYAVTLMTYPVRDFAAVEAADPNLILLDYIFTEEAIGMDTLLQLRLHPATATVPIVMCTTAMVQVREIEASLKTKGVIVVYKPFGVSELLAAIRDALALPPAAGTLPPASESAVEPGPAAA